MVCAGVVVVYNAIQWYVLVVGTCIILSCSGMWWCR